MLRELAGLRTACRPTETRLGAPASTPPTSTYSANASASSPMRSWTAARWNAAPAQSAHPSAGGSADRSAALRAAQRARHRGRLGTPLGRFLRADGVVVGLVRGR